jgi:hypothetical protein
MNSEEKKNIYDNIKISIRSLTVIIALGLLMMAILMMYGYYTGRISENNSIDLAPANGEAEPYEYSELEPTVSITEITCFNSSVKHACCKVFTKNN